MHNSYSALLVSGIDEWLDRIQVGHSSEGHFQIARAPVPNVSHISGIGPHCQRRGRVHMQEQRQAVLLVQHHGGKVLQSLEGGLQAQVFALHIVAQRQGVVRKRVK